MAGPNISQNENELYSKLDEDVRLYPDETTTETYNRVLADQIVKWT